MGHNEKIVFTNMANLNNYNEKLLSEFVDYLNKRHKKNHDIFHCGAAVQIFENKEIIKDFLQSMELKDSSCADDRR